MKFKPGAAHEARQIISEHFWPVGRVLNRDVIAFDFYFGEWDHVVYFQIRDDGPDPLYWIPGPTMASWLETFYEREGGKENGAAIWTRYNELVQRCKTEIAAGSLWRAGYHQKAALAGLTGLPRTR